MKKIDLGQTITILANVGVIAGIVFLGLELEQNNNLLRAQASFSLLENRSFIRREVAIASSDVMDSWVRIQSNAPLTAADELRLNSYIEGVFLNWQFEYGQYIDGNLSEAELPVSGFRVSYHGDGIMGVRTFPVVWQSFRNQLEPRFVQWMEENVVN